MKINIPKIFWWSGVIANNVLVCLVFYLIATEEQAILYEPNLFILYIEVVVLIFWTIVNINYFINFMKEQMK